MIFFCTAECDNCLICLRSYGKIIVLINFEIWVERKRMRKKTNKQSKQKVGLYVITLFFRCIYYQFYHHSHRASYLYIFFLHCFKYCILTVHYYIFLNRSYFSLMFDFSHLKLIMR